MKKQLFFTLCVAALDCVLTMPLRGAVATIDPDTTYQTIDGFGASNIAGGSAGLYADNKFLNFVAYDLGLSIYRTAIAPGVLQTPVEDAADIHWEDFDLISPQGTAARIALTYAKGLTLRQPEIRVIGSVWSPPAWMKDNNSHIGNLSGYVLDNVDPTNRLSDDKYEHFAKFLVEYTRLFENSGVPVYAISPQNELMFTQVFESCQYKAPEYARIVRTLGQSFAGSGMERPYIFGPEDMTQAHYGTTTRHRPYVDALMAADTRDYFDIFATHGYTNGFQASSTGTGLYWNGIKDFGRRYWLTEGGTGEHNWPAPIASSGISGFIHNALVQGNASAFVAWQITDIFANIHGIMHGANPTKKTYAAMHYMRYIRPGFVRIGATLSGSDSSGLWLSAFRDESRRRVVVVVINTNSSARTFDLNLLGDVDATELEVFQTTSAASDNFRHVGTLDLSSANPSISLPASSIVTLASVIPVEGISVTPQMDLDIGANGQLTATLEPEDSSNRKLVWESSDPTVATVSGAGTVTGIDEGEAIITVTSDDGTFSASSVVNVAFSQWADWPVQASSFVDTGDDFMGILYVRKDTAWVYSYNTASWIYLPESWVTETQAWAYMSRRNGGTQGMAVQAHAEPHSEVVTITGDTMTPHADAISNVLIGKPIIVSSEMPDGARANLNDGDFGAGSASTRWITTFQLGDPIPPEWAKIDMGTLYHFTEFRLHPYERRGYGYTIEISEDDVEYTTVVNRISNQDGTVFTNSVDAVGRYVRLTIYFPTYSGQSHMGVYVNLQELEGYGSQVNVPVTGVHLETGQLLRGIGQTYTLRAGVLPAIASEQQIQWSSDNTGVATVDANGYVTAIAAGEATVMATSVDGGFTAATQVIVGSTPIWGEWPISAEGRVNSEGFAGEMQVYPGFGWVYLYDAGCWAWLPESALFTDGAWTLLLR